MKNMAAEKDSRIKTLLDGWRSGEIYTARRLKRMGYSSALLNSYKKNGWIRSIGHGVYAKLSDKPTLFHAVSALQKQLDFGIHIGGQSALQIHGAGQNVVNQFSTLHLYKETKRKLPAWFTEVDRGMTPVVHISTIIKSSEAGFQTEEIDEAEIVLASRERAILERISHISSTHNFMDAWHSMESLSLLRPRVVHQLLESCSSVKVKRIFLFMTSRLTHTWTKKIDTTQYDLGSGSRSIVEGGKLDQEFMITVPGELADV